MSRTLVIQPLPGIGDMIWHLAHIRAVAEHAGEPVTLVTKPSALAEQIFRDDPAVDEVLCIGRRQRFVALELARSLASRRFQRSFLLHHSGTLAFVLAAAGVPERHGYGFAAQRRWLNRGPFLPQGASHLHPFDQATAWLRAAGIPLPDPQPRLDVRRTARTAARNRAGVGRSAFIVLGIACSQIYKQWGAERFAALARLLHDAGWHEQIMLGGSREAEIARAIRDVSGLPLREAMGWDVPDLAALCAEAEFFVGNDTGAMNVAAAVGTRTYGLTGGVAPFHFSPDIEHIFPSDGHIDPRGGMARIAPEAVIAAIAADRGSLAPPEPAISA